MVGRSVSVTLLDRRNYHTFFPLLYQVAAAELVPTDIAYPVRSIFRKAANVDVRLAEMTGLDLSKRMVRTDRGSIEYDYLVLGMGSEPNFFGVEGADRHAFPLRWMDDAILLRHHVLTRFEEAAGASPKDRKRLLTFVVVGGGPTGVEYAGALSELIHGPLLQDFKGITNAEVQVVLVEATSSLLGGMPETLRAYAMKRLEGRHVTVLLDTAVEAVFADHVRLIGGELLATDTVVWTAGIQGEPKAAEWGLPVGRGGRIPVSETLSLYSQPEVYVVGDLAYREDAQEAPLPQVAQVAIQQGRHAALNILRSTADKPRKAFEYSDRGMLAVIGRNAAVAHAFGHAFKGRVAWLLWLGIHITWLIGFRNRVLVLLSWAWDYVFFRRAVRLILPTVSSTGDTK